MNRRKEMIAAELYRATPGVMPQSLDEGPLDNDEYRFCAVIARHLDDQARQIDLLSEALASRDA